MRKLLFFLFMTLTCHGLSAQDLIVTSEGDSLNCKITKEAKDRLHFTFVHKGEVRNTLLSRHLIKHYQHNFYATSEIPENYARQNTEVYPRFLLGASGGWSYRTASTPDGIQPFLEDYLKELKQGITFSADAGYYFSEQMGVGLNFSSHHASHEIDNVSTTQPDGTVVYGKLSDDISITYIGPYFSSRLMNANKLNAWIFNIGLGYMGYKDEAVQVTDRLSMKSSTLGFTGSIGYDMRIAKKLSLGLQVALVSGTLKKIDVSTGTMTQTIRLEPENYENLSRIDVTVGLRFNH